MSAAGIGRALAWLVILATLAAGGWWLTREPPVAVTVATAETGLVERTVANTRAGTVKACQRAQMSLPIGGQIAALNVKEGDRVERGELLVELWNEDLKALREQAALAAESAHLEHDAICIRARNSRRESDRLKRLAARNLTSEEAAEQAQSQAAATATSCAAAKAREREAGAAVTVAEARLEKTRLYAPFGGIVAEVRGEVGEYSTPSPPGVATLPAIDLLTDDCHYVEAPIDEVDVAAIDPDLPLRVSFDAIPDRSFTARIRQIAPYVLDIEKQARTVTLEAVLTEAPAPRLFAGYSADVEVIVDSRAETLRIPTEAVLEERFVLLFRPDRPLERREITLGISNWRYSEVLKGLEAGDRVVTSLGRDGVAAEAEVVLE